MIGPLIACSPPSRGTKEMAESLNRARVAMALLADGIDTSIRADFTSHIVKEIMYISALSYEGKKPKGPGFFNTDQDAQFCGDETVSVIEQMLPGGQFFICKIPFWKRDKITANLAAVS
jgi:hypothetical protein